MSGRVFTVPPGLPFVDALASGILAQSGGEPAALADTLVLLPTRRAVRALADAFLRVGDRRAAILPRMVPIGDIDDDELDAAIAGADALTLPPAIAPLRRQILLARLILARGENRSPAQAAKLAAELARLLDQVETEELSFEALKTLVKEKEFAQHWQITLDFLDIVMRAWPEVLREEGVDDPAVRRNKAIAVRIAAWGASPPTHPVIAAGSTGSIKATARLLAAVANLADGAVVLPGLDKEIDEKTRETLTESHPQFSMMRLLRDIGVAPRDVPEWTGSLDRTTNPNRALFAAAAMRPAEAGPIAPPTDAHLDGVVRIDCPSPREEAATIALVLRWALDEPGRTAALVTPDRTLARRVAAELKRWDIAIDDSAGQRLADTAPGTFLRLIARMVAERAAPVPLLAALKHPLAGREMAFRARVRALEREVLRGPRPAPGFEGIVEALEEKHRDIAVWLEAMAAAAQPFAALIERRFVRIEELLAAHVAFAEWLGGPEKMWAGEAGEALALVIDELAASSHGFAPIDGQDWPALFEALIEGRVVRPRFGRHPRLAIWGPLEARLQRADVLVLGGLNEGTWPPDPGADPWLSRPMREEFGLPPPEWRVGLSAHDFAQAFSAPRVVLTRATRVDGTPTVPSRWLLRLEAIAPSLAADGARSRILGGHDLLALALGLDDPAGESQPVARPAPRPPLAARPKGLYATQVEMLMRDPYSIYARHILGLRALDPLDADPGAAERGQCVHEAMDKFLKAFPDALPDDALAQLLDAGREAFAPMFSRPGVWAFWWPRFVRVAEWVVTTERERRATLRPVASEATGEIVVDGFKLSARVDRIDRGPNGLSIVDYKTGALPSPTDIRLGFAPQLALEAVIAERGGFKEVAGKIENLAFWRLAGGAPPGEEKEAKDARRLIGEAALGIAALVAEFAKPETPYLSQPSPRRAPRYSDYKLLARVKEWSAVGEEE